jgi:peptidoglycan hydrolase-like protein with peptidoglycan-binding domain
MMKLITRQILIPQLTFALSGVFCSTALAVGSMALPRTAIANSAFPTSISTPALIATAYTDLTLPTVQRGDRGKNVQLLQQILSDNGFLHAAGIKLGTPSGAVVDGIFGPITESAVRDIQQRYDISVTGRVNPTTWEVLDMQENPYRSPLPWKE